MKSKSFFRTAAPKVLFPVILMALAPLLWGGNFVVGRLIVSDIPVIWLNVGRWAVAALVLLPIGLRGLLRDRRALWRARSKLVLLSLLGVIGFNTVVYSALQSVTASHAAIVFAVTPVLIVVFLALINRHWPEPRVMVLACLSAAGVWMTQADRIRAHGCDDCLGGSLLMLVAAVIWAIYSIALRKLKIAATPLSAFLAQILIGLASMVPLALIFLDAPPLGAFAKREWLSLGYLGVFASAVAFLSWQVALRRCSANLAGLFMNLLPLSSLVLAWIFLGEVLAPREIIGGMMVFASLALVMMRAPPRPRPRPVERADSMTSAE